MNDPCAFPLGSAPVVVLAISSSDRDSIVPGLWYFAFPTFDLDDETDQGIVDVTDVAYRCVLQHLYRQGRGRRNETPLHLCLFNKTVVPRHLLGIRHRAMTNFATTAIVAAYQNCVSQVTLFPSPRQLDRTS